VLAALAALALLAFASATGTGAGTGSGVERQYPTNFPTTGGGAPLAYSRCVTCHSAMLTMQQAKDSAAWERTLTQMEAWGSPPLSPGERDTLRTWLLANWGPRKR
jgi:hypothetical protein